MQTSNPSDMITLGGGCFWCIEAVFLELKGVTKTESGFAGGHKENPTYEEVCGGNTGHVEVVKVNFDPKAIQLRDILYIFFSVHDPTTLDRQGADIGTQYRSVIFYNSDEQKKMAVEVIAELEEQKIWSGIVTKVMPLTNYYKAEEYHQNYYNRNPGQGYCNAVISPKLTKFRKKFHDQLKK